MQVCPIASARATIGGPSFEPRTPSRKAWFHETTMLSPCLVDPTRRAAAAVPGSPGSRRSAPPTPAAARNCRRDMPTSDSQARGRPWVAGRSGCRVIEHSVASSPFAGPGGRQWTPPSLSRFRVLTNVEVRAAAVYSGDRSRNVVVGRGTLRGRDALEDSGRRAGSVAADRQDALAAVGERDLEDGGAIDPRPVVDIVDEWWCRRGLRTRVDPADQPRDCVGAACAT